MKTLLRIDASSQRELSHSRKLADHFENRWQKQHPDGTVLKRDLARNPLPHLDEETIAVFYSDSDSSNSPPPHGIALSDQLIAELKNADAVLISSPLYNCSMPSCLKAWIDHIVRYGHTVAYTAEGPKGLVTGKPLCILSARGGNVTASPDFQIPALQAIFAYIGFRDINAITLEGTRIPDGKLDQRIANAKQKIDDYLQTAHSLTHGNVGNP